MKFIDFFAGIGGFHSGLELAGHECVGWVEWDKFARQSYQAIYDVEGVYNASDIRAIGTGSELPSADIWCFGSPCQNISIAGNRKGLEGGQSGMFLEVMRLLNDREEESKPSYLFMENVKNLLSVNGGWDFARVILEMDKAGYDVEWQVINSSWVIPQNRERIFIVGHKRGRRTRRVFPLTSEEIGENRKYTILRELLEDADKKYELSEDKIRRLLNSEDAQRNQFVDNKMNIIGNWGRRNHSSQDVVADFGISRTILSSNAVRCTPVVATAVYPLLAPDRIKKRQNGRAIKKDGEPSFTLTTADKHGVILVNGAEFKVRRLTPLECWRLQGFEDQQFYKAKAAGVSDSQLYKQAGNAVTVPVIKKIAEQFKLED